MKARTCVCCPKRDHNGVCLIRGQLVVADHPSCTYGRKMKNNEYSAMYMRKRRMRKRLASKKRRP